MGRPPPRRGHFRRGGGLAELYGAPLIPRLSLVPPRARSGNPVYDPPVTNDDPFPRERIAAVFRRLPAYLRLSWRLARDPLLSRARRAAVIGAAGYLASPIDLVPGVIPVLGQLDDLAVALAAIRLALSGLSPERRRVHLDAVGLADEDLTADLRTVWATTTWLLRAGARTTARAAKAGGRAAVAGAGLAARSSKVMATKSTSAARSASGAARSASTAARSVSGTASGAARLASTAVRSVSGTASTAARSASGAAIARIARIPRRRIRDLSAETLAVEHEGDAPEMNA